MTQPQPVPNEAPVFTEDEVLQYTQRIRKQIVGELMPAGTAPTGDPKQMGILLQTLSGMDSAALGKMRIKVEEKATASQEHTAQVISELLQKIGGDVRPFEVLEGCTREVPTLGDDVPPPVLVEGETESGTLTSNYVEFTAKYQNPDGTLIDVA